jgi:phage terminase small subunit
MSEENQETPLSKQKPFSHRLNKLIAGVSEQDKPPTEAARAAGYSESYSRVDVYSTLEKPSVKAEIERRRESRMAEANIHANEVLGTLASHMRADIGEIMPDNPIVQRAREAGVSHWIRKVTVKEYFDKSKQATVTETTVELHNAQTAAKQLCAVMGLEVAAAKNPYDAARAAYERLLLEHPGIEKRVIADRVGAVYGVEAKLLYE